MTNDWDYYPELEKIPPGMPEPPVTSQGNAETDAAAQAPMDDRAGIEWFERTFGVPLGDKPGAADVERVRAAAVPSADRCARCGCETKGEVAWVDGAEWCHPCADNAAEAAWERHCEDFHDGGCTRFNTLTDQQIEARKLK
jgi:hypothetical protein